MRTSAPQSYQLPPDKYQAAVDLNRQLDILYFVGVAWAVIVLAIMVRRGVGPRWSRLGAWSVPMIVAVPWIASLPLSMYRHWLGLHYKLSVESWAPWLWDWIKGGVIELGLTSALIVAGLWFIRRSPRRWWIYCWAVSVVVAVAGTFAMPLVFDPLFHAFRPLSVKHADLIAPIEAVVARAGQTVPPDRIFEMAASEKTRTLNAYMTGFGPVKRIVIWDTAIARLTPPQIQTVFAHELGHYALGHIPRALALGSVALLIVFFVIRRWTFDYASVPRCLLVATIAGFLAEPVVNTYSRWQEAQADRYELQIMKGLIPDAGANSAQVDQIMAEISLDDPNPNPFIEFWLYDHPSTNDRIRASREGQPE